MTKDAEKLLIAAGKAADEAMSGKDWNAVVKASGVNPQIADSLLMSRLVNDVEVEGELQPYISLRYGGAWQLSPAGANKAADLIRRQG